MILDQLEAAKGGPFRVRPSGSDKLVECPVPRDMPYTVVAMCLEDSEWFRQRVIDVGDVSPDVQTRLIESWRLHHDLPTFNEVRRLVYLIQRYGEDLESDLQVHATTNLGQLWRGREWRRLLVLIDRLPPWSRFSQAVANDEEHIEMLVKAIKEGKKPPATPVNRETPVFGYTPVVQALHGLTNEFRLYRTDFVAANRNPKKSSPPKPPILIEPPVNAWIKAQRRAEKEEKLTGLRWIADNLFPGRVVPAFLRRPDEET